MGKGDEKNLGLHMCLLGIAFGTETIPLLYTEPKNKPADSALVGKTPIRVGIV